MDDPKGGRTLTRAIILTASHRAKSQNISQDNYLSQITHLHLQSKKIKKIDKLECCPNLRVLYLYDNKIEVLENIEHADLLSYLYLENNQIKKLPDFTNVKLKKIFLDENAIDYVKGFGLCSNLVHLSVARQRIPKFSSITFDPDSLNAISNTLQTLDISGNGISQLSPFYVLYNLTKFLCNDNNISDISEAEGIVSLPLLEEVNFMRNPMCSLRHYRDYIIGAASESLTILDDVPICNRHLVAIKGLQKLRQKLGLDSGSMLFTERQADENSSNNLNDEDEENMSQKYSNEYEDKFNGQSDDLSVGGLSRSTDGGQVVETEYNIAKF